MKTVTQIIDDVLKAEGGFVDDPADRGGATNHGISLRYARGIGLDLDGDGDTDADDIKAVTPKIARECYLEDFYIGPRIHALPVDLHPQLVDWAVNSGPAVSVQGLQKTLNRRFGYDLSEDGRVGKKTRIAAQAACKEYGWQRVNNDLVDTRCAFYKALVHARPSQERFLKGWLRRAESFRA